MGVKERSDWRYEDVANDLLDMGLWGFGGNPEAKKLAYAFGRSIENQIEYDFWGTDMVRLIYSNNDTSIQTWMNYVVPNFSFVSNKIGRGTHLLIDDLYYRYVSAPGFLYLFDQYVNWRSDDFPSRRNPCKEFDLYY